ncbi:hypothetical protein [Ornithinibacillus californiensis]|uniref:hypothetical protein n=1 Tax=Ornithinibacillus californiensis TaxID=161536 RepID=UPI00069D491A|nr:hypothetical protein [Ornithinibacillus californiensis]
MQHFRNNLPINHHQDERFIGPLAAGLIGAGIGYIGGELFDGPHGYGPGFWGYGPGYGGYPGYPGYPGYGGYGPGYPGYGYNNFPGYQGYPSGYGYQSGFKPGPY